MNELTTFRLSETALIAVLFVGVLLFLGMTAVRYIGNAIFSKSKLWKVFQRFGPSVEALIWLIFVVRSIGLLIDDPIYYHITLGAIATVSVLCLSWFAGKDWIAGLVFKTQRVYETGQRIRIGEEQGRIRRLGYLSLDVETKNGEHLTIPYSRITGRIHGTSQPEASTRYHRFEVRTTKTQTASSTMKDLRAAILYSPWSSHQKEPQIRLLSESVDGFLFEAVVYSPGSEYSRAIEEDVRAAFSSQMHEIEKSSPLQ